jgi:competence protein ComEC
MLGLIERTGDLGFVSVTVPAFPLLPVITFYVGLLLIMFQSKKVYGAVLVPLSLVVMFGYAFLPDDTAFEATFLDVGQAESAVIKLPDKKVMVVDTGKDGKQTAAYLDYIGVDEVDALILSHAGYDHAGGIHYLTDSKEVGTVYDNGRIRYPEYLRSRAHRVKVKRGDVMRGKEYTIEILHPYDEFHTAFGSAAAAENNESLVLRITVDGKRLLFTGDIEHEAEDDMVHLGDYLKSDILKVAHHGSKTSTSEQFVSLVRPSVAVISSGMFNPYGHPHRKTLRSLGSVMTLNTAQDGAVKIRLEGRDRRKDFTVKTFREYTLKPADTFTDEVANFQKLFRTW